MLTTSEHFASNWNYSFTLSAVYRLINLPERMLMNCYFQAFATMAIVRLPSKEKVNKWTKRYLQMGLIYS